MQIRRILALTAVFALVVGTLSIEAQKKDDNKNQPKRSKAEQQDLETVLRYVDTAMSAQAPAPDYKVTWLSNHYILAQQGDVYVPFTLDVDPALRSKPLAYYVRVVEKGAAAPVAPVVDPKNKDQKNAPPPPVPTYPWNTFTYTQVGADGQMARAIQLKPGEYDAYILIKEKGAEVKDPSKAPPPKVALVKQSLSIPNFATPDLKTSSVIVASLIEPLPAVLSPAELEVNPYSVFGPVKIIPTIDSKFAKGKELSLIFFIYGAGDAGGKPDVTVEYNFHQKLAEGEKYFNRAPVQALNMPGAAGAPLLGELSVPLASFPVGDFRLEIKVTDKTSGKSVVQNVPFTVTA